MLSNSMVFPTLGVAVDIKSIDNGDYYSICYRQINIVIDSYNERNMIYEMVMRNKYSVLLNEFEANGASLSNEEAGIIIKMFKFDHPIRNIAITSPYQIPKIYKYVNGNKSNNGYIKISPFDEDQLLEAYFKKYHINKSWWGNGIGNGISSLEFYDINQKCLKNISPFVWARQHGFPEPKFMWLPYLISVIIKFIFPSVSIVFGIKIWKCISIGQLDLANNIAIISVILCLVMIAFGVCLRMLSKIK